MQFQYMQKSHKNRLHSHKMVFSLFLVLYKSVMPRKEPTELIFGMFLVKLSLLRKHKCLALFNFFVRVNLIHKIILFFVSFVLLSF